MRELERLKEVVGKYVDDAKMDAQKLSFLQLLDVKHDLSRAKQTLLQQMEQAENADSEAQTNQIMNQLKQDKDVSKALAEQVQAARQRTESLIADVDKCKSQMKNFTGEMHEQYKKYKEQYKKCEEFMSNFTQAKQQDLQTMSHYQELIVQLLEHMSDSLQQQQQQQDTTMDKYNELNEQLSFKQEEHQRSETTLDKIRKELQLRRKDADKLNGLDKKMEEDLQMHQQKILQMSQELQIYQQLDQLKVQSEHDMSQLRHRKEEVFRLRDSMKQQMHMLTRKNTALRGKLNGNAVYEQLNDLETRIRVYEQNNFALAECIIHIYTCILIKFV